jgi:hypothetical protein
MDVSALIKKSYQNYGTIIGDSYYHLYYEYLRQNVSNPFYVIFLFASLVFTLTFNYSYFYQSYQLQRLSGSQLQFACGVNI